MGHCLPTMEMGRGQRTFARGPVMKHKARPKKKNRNWSFQETRFQDALRRGGGLNIQRYTRNHPPEAPRNTTSYIIRSKSMGDALAPVVTPSPWTPAVLPTPGPLPRYKEQFSEEAKEWGLDGYGSMNGLIRMKARDMEAGALVATEEEDNDDDETGGEQSKGQYAQSLQQLEHRMDQGLNRFEMVYPRFTGTKPTPSLQVVLVDQEHHIAQLEEENISLRERLSHIERELGALRSRINVLEGGSDHNGSGEVVSERSIGNVT